MAKKKKKSGGKVLPAVIITAIVVFALCIFVPKLVHKCDHCGKTFFGTGYAPNIITETFNDEEIICEDCETEEYTAFGIRAGEKEDHKLPLFPSSGDEEKTEKNAEE